MFPPLFGPSAYVLSSQAPLAGFASAILDSRTTGLQVMGDSTGNETTEWVYLFAQWLAGKYPAYTVNYRLWNDTNQNYDATTTIQTGTDGARYAKFAGVDSMRVVATDIPEFVNGADIDIRMKIAPSSWRPAADQVLAARFGSGGFRVFRFTMRTTGVLYLEWTTDGSTLSGFKSSTVALTNTPGATLWVRVVHDWDNGASGNDVKFYTSSDGTTWTQLGTTITTAGTITNYYTGAGSTIWEIGARGVTAEPYSGKIYNVEILNGIGGYPINPVPIDSWQPATSTETFVGAPEIWIINASVSGAGLTYLDDSTRRPKMLLNYGQTACIISCSHNEGRAFGGVEIAAYATFVTNIKAALKRAAIVFATQNPRTSPATNIREHGIRRAEIMAWTQRNSAAYIDTYGAFLKSGIAMSTLVDPSDGIHPISAGKTLWAQTVENSFLASI